MKFLTFVLTAVLSQLTFATSLLPEAYCYGKDQNGLKVAVTTYANPDIWCGEDSQRSAQSVVSLQTAGGLAEVVVTKQSIASTPNEDVMVTHTSTWAEGALALTYFTDTKKGILELKDEDEHEQILLNCELQEYQLDCDQD